MVKSMKRIRVCGTGEVVEKKSRFIANVFNIENEDEAAQIIISVKKKYWDARHNCYAYVCGENNGQQKFSDDGEPAGTAGKPILDVIIRSGISNCLIVVTRYFGGTLLGTGGLIRAYQAAAVEGIACSEVMEVFSGEKAEVITDYNNLGKLQYICSDMNINILETEYGENVSIKLIINGDIYEQFVKRITEAFSGTMNLTDVQKCKYALINGEKVLEI